MSIRDEEIDVLARTIWGEARGEGPNGMMAVAEVIITRVKHAKRWPNDVISVCQQPFQFSCWNENDPNLGKLLAVDDTDATFAAALDIAQLAVDGLLQNTTKGADHYHEQSINPRWAHRETPVAVIGRHKFYKLA